MEKLLSLVIAPIFVGLVLKLVSRWLDEKDDQPNGGCHLPTRSCRIERKKSRPIRNRTAFVLSME